MEIKGIDVSSYQGNIDWGTVADYGMDFAILRITEKGNKTDPTFERNYLGCQKYGIPVGVYKYSYAKTVAQAEAEAAAVLKALDGRKLNFPVFYDLEWNEQRALGVSAIEKITLAFLNKIKEAGYLAGIYCNADWYENALSAELKEHDCWIARYPDNDNGELQERLRPVYGVGWQYSSKAVIPGIPAKVDRDVFYKDYETEKEEENETMARTAKAVLDVMRMWIGYNEANGKHKYIIDLYNSVKPLPRGYAVKYTDEWCDATVSAAGIKAGSTDLIGRECGCEEHIKIFKQMGIWIEDGTITPKPGDIILYNWNQNYQPNDGYADHIGYVESVSNGQITCIEGNKGEAVARRVLSVGNGNIRGYARPKYDAETGGSTPSVPETPSTEALSRTVAWYGVVNTAELNVRTWAGTEHANLKSYPTIKQGTKVGVCDTIQDKDGDPWYYVVVDGTQGEKYGFVSAVYITKQNASTPDAPSSDGAPSKTPKWVGKVTASVLNVRAWAGTNNPVIKAWPQLAKGNLVDVCDTVTAADGSRWYYIRIDGRIFGFAHSAYIAKA